MLSREAIGPQLISQSEAQTYRRQPVMQQSIQTQSDSKTDRSLWYSGQQYCLVFGTTRIRILA
jgi:hypothetical protein